MLTLRQIDEISNLLLEHDILSILLKDRSTKKNILWGISDYEYLGNGYTSLDTIDVSKLFVSNTEIIKPRIEKNKDTQELRSKEKAEVFTPLWVCNVQNNLIDDAWFGISRKRFNTEKQESWETNYYPISFAETNGKSWTDYIRASRLEISCGEAPYLTTRYDTITGKYVSVRRRVGLLDRKLRVISENVSSSEEWIEWALIAVQNIYGYDWQGDNVFLSRKNILSSVLEEYYEMYNSLLPIEIVLKFAEVISWNIWQMDGIKFVVPNSCHAVPEEQIAMFASEIKMMECPGCKTCNPRTHTGNYCKIMDWESKSPIRFIDLMKGADS